MELHCKSRRSTDSNMTAAKLSTSIPAQRSGICGAKEGWTGGVDQTRGIADPAR